jgi:uncharacterized protein
VGIVVSARNRPSDEKRGSYNRSEDEHVLQCTMRDSMCNACPSVAFLVPLVKFHLSTAEGNVVTGTGPGWVRVGADEHRDSLVIAPDTIVKPWAATFEALDEGAFERVKALSPEIVLLGTGARQRFPHPRLYRMLTAERIGVEVMDSGAAARTYNIIAAEGRRVAAALILP